MSSVVVIGQGNIGSHLLPPLARSQRVRKLTLIDRDYYEASNLLGQDISPADVGRPKAVVQAARLRRIRPALEVEAIQGRVEDVPLGRLRADVILACVDSRRARQYVNQAAWRLGVPWIDSGVDPGGLLARVNAYVPAEENPCIECSWDDRDYASLEVAYPCTEGQAPVAATNAPSSLGALAASLQAIECEKLLSGRAERAVVGRQVMLDALHHKHYLTTFARNPRCRFDHEVWTVEKLNLGAEMRSLHDLFRHVCGNGNIRESRLRVEGKPFVSGLTCSGCGHRKSVLRLLSSLSARERNCALCGQPMAASGWDHVETLTGNLPARTLSRPLQRFGIRDREILSLGDSEETRHFEIIVTGSDHRNRPDAKSRKQKTCREAAP